MIVDRPERGIARIGERREANEAHDIRDSGDILRLDRCMNGISWSMLEVMICALLRCVRIVALVMRCSCGDIWQRISHGQSALCRSCCIATPCFHGIVYKSRTAQWDFFCPCRILGEI